MSDTVDIWTLFTSTAEAKAEMQNTTPSTVASTAPATIEWHRATLAGEPTIFPIRGLELAIYPGIRVVDTDPQSRMPVYLSILFWLGLDPSGKVVDAKLLPALEER